MAYSAAVGSSNWGTPQSVSVSVPIRIVVPAGSPASVAWNLSVQVPMLPAMTLSAGSIEAMRIGSVMSKSR